VLENASTASANIGCGWLTTDRKCACITARSNGRDEGRYCQWSALKSADMQMRYRYRLEPTPAQLRMLARVFGCCRVVFNDALRVRDEAYRAG
jgi:Helix-turn-helix domain